MSHRVTLFKIPCGKSPVSKIRNCFETTSKHLRNSFIDFLNGFDIVSADVASGVPTQIDIIAGANAGYDDVGGSVNITGGAGTHPDPAG